MITVPVLLGFDGNKPIGSMTIDETQLPNHSYWNFSIGYKAHKQDKIELLCVGLINEGQQCSKAGE